MKKIPEIKLKLSPQSEEAKAAIGYKYNPDAGDRSKLGGDPDWIQQPEWPICCGEMMTFYGQLDSIGDNFDLADCGMIYVFVCYDCFNTVSILHAY